MMDRVADFRGRIARLWREWCVRFLCGEEEVCELVDAERSSAIACIAACEPRRKS